MQTFADVDTAAFRAELMIGNGGDMLGGSVAGLSVVLKMFFLSANQRLDGGESW